MNSFATAPGPGGPWTTFVGNATWPWPARGSAAVAPGPTMPDGTGSAYFASGMTFTNGAPSTPVFSDAWLVDVGVCMLAPVNNLVCAGVGTPNNANAACTCNTANYDASKNCGVCATNYWNFAAGCSNCLATSSHGR